MSATAKVDFVMDRWMFCSDGPTVQSGPAKKFGSLNDQEEAVIMTRLTPAIFFGHSNPMNAIGQNERPLT
jgi:hypothetical protein